MTNAEEAAPPNARPWIASALWSQRELLWDFTLLDLRGKYRSSFLGLFWSLIHPLLMLGLYTFLFRVVSHPRWDQTAGPIGAPFVLAAFCGIIVFNLLAECLVRAPLILSTHRNYVKKTVFPIEVLPASIVGSALIHFLIGLSVLIAGMLVCGWMPSPRIVLLPLVLLPLVLLCLGFSWLFALAGVYSRDVAYAMPFASQALFLLTPIVYPLAAVPMSLRPLFQLNPLALIVEQAREAVLFGGNIEWGSWLLVSASAALMCLVGYEGFMRAKKFLADNL